MRHPIAIAAVLALAAVATDAAAQSRYGPRPATLSWPGKADHDPSPLQDQVARRPEPLAPWAQRLASNATTGQPQNPQVIVPAPVAQAPAVQPRAQLPTSLYDAPAPVRTPQPAPRQAPQAIAPQAAAPQPAAPRAAQPQTALLGAPSPTPAPNASPGPRFYSVYREYGYSPDQIPVAPAPALNGARGGSVVELRDVPQTQSLAAPDDTQYVPPRVNQSSSR